MTHSVVLDLPENVYQSLMDKAAYKGKRIEEIAVEILSNAPLDIEEFERLSDELADEFAKRMPPDAKPLSDYAMSREGLHEDHL
jgi:plasmid stability protein